MSVESGLDGIFEFVGGRRMTGAAEILVQVIDAAVVRETAAGVEHGYFGRDTGLSQFHERAVWVAQGRKLVTVFAFMLANFFCRFGLVRVNQPERGFAFVFGADVLNSRRVPIRDRAIRPDEDEDNDFSLRFLERIGRSTGECQRRILG
ncbi:MAG: hypothetical protein AUI91_15230 [Acidobacteria bacterium 13_1_40CM_3_56_11]|nr:MAG: hypothetical protein AUI91_15230 [Acidobacteria bacterium 13_1_40CM_3_56_11]